MKAGQKLKSRAGFTLAETLLAVLILLLVSVVVATGIPAAKNAYAKVVVASNGQVMLSTAATALREELGTAWDVEIKDNGEITYYSANTGGLSKIESDSSEGIMLTEYGQVNQFNIADENYLNKESGSYIPEGRRLVTKEAGPGGAAGNLIVTYEGVTPATDGTDCIVFSKLTVGSTEYPNLASIDTLTVPVLSVKSS